MAERDAAITFATALATTVHAAIPGSLVGAYLHGSAALGGFVPGKSDIDILFVVRRPLSPEEKAAAAHFLSNHGPCPGSGIETSIILESCARDPQPGAYELHVTTGADAKVIDGAGRADSDLVLHALVCRAAGITVFGPPASEVFGDVPRALVLSRLRDELAWARAHAPAEYAVLNACRALRYAREGVVCSKVAGGEWARAALSAFAPLITAALARQSGDTIDLDQTKAGELLDFAIEELAY